MSLHYFWTKTLKVGERKQGDKKKRGGSKPPGLNHQWNLLKYGNWYVSGLLHR